MANDALESLSAELKERIAKLPVLSSRSTVAGVAAEAHAAGAATAPDAAALQATIEKLTKEKSAAEAAVGVVIEKYETLAAEAKTALDAATAATTAAQTALAEAQKKIPAQVAAATSQGVQEGLAACAVPAASLPAPTTIAAAPKTREDLETAMAAEKEPKKRLEMLREFRKTSAN